MGKKKENKPSKDKSSYFLSDNNITDSEPTFQQ